MPTREAIAPTADLRQIRRHGTSQEDGFEELCFELIPTIARLPAAQRLVRHKAPDGGIEFSCLSPNGSGRWAWQSKFLFSLDASAYTQMDESFAAAMATTPDLTRYVFVLPTDRTGRAPRAGAASGIARWESQVGDWERVAKAKGITLSVDFIGASELLGALLRPEHSGQLRYFFDQTFLTPIAFATQVEREIANLGPRYRPEVNVDLEIAQVLETVARSDAWRARVDHARRQVHLYDLRESTSSGTAAAAAIETVLRGAGAALDHLVTSFDDLCDPTSAAVTAARRAFDTVLRNCEGAEERLREEIELVRGATEPDRPRLNELYAVERRVWEVARSLRDVDELLASEAGAIGQLVLDGEAGSGKSHLLADVARSRIGREAPTILLLGQDFVERDLWAQIAEITGINLDREELLKSLSVAAQVAGKGRCLILIDGVNESAGMRVWPSRLAGFLADLQRYPWIGVVLAVRSTYASDLVGTVAVPRKTHPGLDGHEEEALSSYAAFYELRLADLPPLLPESTNPLFLGSMCRVIQSSSSRSVPRTGVGATWVFEGLLDTIEAELSKPYRLDFSLPGHPVRAAVEQIAYEMLRQVDEALEWSAAERICEAALASPGGYSRSLLNALISEGLLLEERSATRSEVRFTYQRLGDHLMGQELIRRSGTADELRREIERITAARSLWSCKGLLEALAILVPEALGLELVDLLCPPAARRSRSRRASGTSGAAERLLTALLVKGIHWRSGASVTSRTIELAQRAVESGIVDSEEWVDLLVRLATVPEHPMNANRTAKILAEMPMWKRDLAWSAPLLGRWGDAASVTRTVQWSLLHGRDAPDEAASLAGQLLVWLLCIPNARIRDRSTKALVALHDRRPMALAALLRQATSQDDPYVVERVAAAAFGWVLRHRKDPSPDLAAWEALSDAGRAVFDTSATTHLLVRHYVRSIIEQADVVSGTEHALELDRAAPSPRSDWSLRPPKRTALARRFGDHAKGYIIDKWDDFYRYTIESTLRHFIPPGQEALKAKRRKLLRATKRVAATQVAEALGALSKDDRGRLEGLLGRLDLRNAEEAFPEWREASRRRDSAGRSLEQLEKYPERIDADGIALLASARMLDAGWTHERFGAVDGGLRRGQGGGRTSVERFGKKYVRIGFYEALGQLADHCAIGEDYQTSEPDTYEGPWQAGNIQDIDPSVVLPLATNPQRGESPWWHSAFAHRLTVSDCDAQWARSMDDVPTVRDRLGAVDSCGHEWLVVDSQMEWEHTFDRPSTGIFGDRRQMWFSTDTYIVHAADLERISVWARCRNWMGGWMPTDRYGASTGFFGAYPDLAPWPSALADREDAVAPERPDWRKVRGLGPHLGLTVAPYSFSSERDASVESGSAACQMPSTLLLGLLNARWTPSSDNARALGLGPIERERSWSSGDEVVAFWTEAPSGRGHALFVRGDALRDALRARGLAAWSTVLGEKIYWTSGDPSLERLDVFGAATLADSGWHVLGIYGEHAAGAGIRVSRIGPVQAGP